MILDTHNHLRNYAGLFRDVDPHPLFDWLLNCRDVAPGTKVDFAGDKLFARALRQETGPRDKFRWETHREYIDLQYILGGGEIIEWSPAATLFADVPYDPATDFQYYSEAAPDQTLRMRDGLFVFLLPEDGHKPLVANGTDLHVHKIIAKIHRSLLVL